MTALKLCALALVGALGSIVIKKHSPQMASVLMAASCLLLILSVLDDLSKITDGIKTIANGSGINSGTLSLALKIMGISLIFEVTSSILIQLGEGSAAKNLLTGGRVLLLSMILPVLFSLIELVSSLMGGG